MTNLEKLISLIIEDLPAPTDSTIEKQDEWGDVDEAFCDVVWRKNSNHVYLHSCEHRLWIIAGKDDGGAWPPMREIGYSPARLKGLLEWMEQEQEVKKIDELQNYAWFHEKSKADPPITKYMYSGYIREDTWDVLERILKNRLTSPSNVL